MAEDIDAADRIEEAHEPHQGEAARDRRKAIRELRAISFWLRIAVIGGLALAAAGLFV